VAGTPPSAGRQIRVRRLAERATDRGWEVVRRARDRGFTSALRTDPAAPVVILSPHLDDAVLDCWSVLTADGPVDAVNIFAAIPPQGTLAHWDRLCRASDSAGFMAERLAEDREALAMAGRRPVSLPFAADPYRSARRTPTLRSLDAALAAAVPVASRVLAPAVLGTIHPDHLLVRTYALALASTGVPVELYADVPYAVQFGWPAWVTGASPDPHLDPEVAWEGSSTLLPCLNRARARVVALDEQAAAAKLRAMRTYRTQFAMLDRGPIGLLSTRIIHSFEVFWPVGP